MEFVDDDSVDEMNPISEGSDEDKKHSESYDADPSTVKTMNYDSSQSNQ